MFILNIKLNNILKVDMLKLDLWLFYIFLITIMKCILDHVFTPWLESKSPFANFFSLSTLRLEGLRSTTWGEFMLVIVCGFTLG
jgi:hypothetical protein